MRWLHSLSAGETIFLALASQWALAAISHSLPKPEPNSGKFYQFTYNLIQFFMSNLSLIRRGAPPSSEEAPK